MRSLYIFVDSERSDQHVNSLVYCVLHCDVRRVVFHHIRGLADAGKAPTHAEGLSGRIMGAVQAQLEGLAERAEYSFKNGPRAGERVQLKEEYGEERHREIKSLYKRVRAIPVSFSNSEIEYADLRLLLRTIAKEGRDAYVDVTAIKKRYLGDIVAAGLVEGLVGLYTFDLTAPKLEFERPWRMLIHELERQPEPAFRYTNLLDTPIYRSCERLLMVRAPRLRVAAAVTVILILAGALGYWYLGAESQVTQTVLAVSGIASIVSLVLVFFDPRAN